MSEVKAEAVEKALKARSMEEEEGRSSDVDSLVSELVNAVVSPAALDCNDAQVLGEALMSSLAKTMPSREITTELLSHMMQRAVSEGLVQAEGLARGVNGLPELMTSIAPAARFKPRRDSPRAGQFSRAGGKVDRPQQGNGGPHH